MFKHGRFSLSKELLRIMVLRKGNYVMAGQSNENIKDWYLCKTPDPTGWELKEYKNGEVAFFSTALARIIQESLEVPEDKKNPTFLVSPFPVVTGEHELYFIIPKPL